MYYQHIPDCPAWQYMFSLDRLKVTLCVVCDVRHILLGLALGVAGSSLPGHLTH